MRYLPVDKGTLLAFFGWGSAPPLWPMPPKKGAPTRPFVLRENPLQRPQPADILPGQFSTGEGDPCPYPREWFSQTHQSIESEALLAPLGLGSWLAPLSTMPAGWGQAVSDGWLRP